MTMSKRVMTQEQIAEAVRIYTAGYTLKEVGKQLNVPERTVRCQIEPFVKIRRPGTVALPERASKQPQVRCPGADDPIGSLPPGHPLYELDQQILRGRRRANDISLHPRSSLVGG